MADNQAGGNVNYYFESLFALVPIAVLGVVRAFRLARRQPSIGLFLIGVFTIYSLAPQARAYRRGATDATNVEVRNAAVRSLEQSLRGRREHGNYKGPKAT